MELRQLYHPMFSVHCRYPDPGVLRFEHKPCDHLVIGHSNSPRWLAHKPRENVFHPRVNLSVFPRASVRSSGVYSTSNDNYSIPGHGQILHIVHNAGSKAGSSRKLRGGPMKCVTDNGICPPPNSSLSIEGDSWKHQRLAPGEGLCFSVFEKLRGAGCTQLGVHHQELGGLGLMVNGMTFMRHGSS